MPAKFLALLASFFFLIPVIHGQIPTATWRSHATYHQATSLAATDNFVYAVSENGFFRVNIQTYATEILDKSTAPLAEMPLSAVAYANATRQLLVGHPSGRIELLTLGANDEVTANDRIDFIRESSAITGNKRINDFAVSNNRVFTATDFGVVEIDLPTASVKETYRNIGPNGTAVSCRQLRVRNDSLFVKTPDGILGGSLSPDINLLYYGNWAKITDETLFTLPSLPPTPLITRPNAATQTPDGHWWVGDAANGLVSNANGAWQTYRPNGLPERQGRFFVRDGQVGFAGKASYLFGGNAWQPTTAPTQPALQTDSYGNEWQIINGTLRVSFGGRFLTFTQFNGLSGRANAFAVATDDFIWVATTNGVTVIISTNDFPNNPTEPFTPSYNGERLLLQQNVTAVAVDPGNRKWLGTKAGLYCFDARIDQQLHFFSADNSPLYDDAIQDLAVDGHGEVFVATETGVVSYQTDASTPATALSQVRFYPNPVKPAYDNFFTIDGLTENARVAILTPDGQLVFSGIANGGTVAWNLHLPDGRLAPSGVYILTVRDEKNGQRINDKFAIIR